MPGIHNSMLLVNCTVRKILKIRIFNKIAVIAPAAENLNSFTEISQLEQNITNNGHEITNNSPRNDATPFPPLNFNQTGNICPNIEKTPHTPPSSLP